MTRRILLTATAAIVGAAALFFASALGPVHHDHASPVIGPVVGSASAAEPRLPAGGTLDDLITRLQTRLTNVPDDHVSWATLGLAYVQQARVTVDPTLYAKADGALAESIRLDDTTNFTAYAGLSALASGRHDFAGARTYAQRGLEIDPYSSILYGALGDAELQLGNYDAAFAAIQRMVDLSPDTSSLSRASYTWELRGDTAQAASLMERALEDAPTAVDRAFALVQLGGLAFDQGDPNGALDRYNAALAEFPDDIAALAGKAKAEAALGQVETAIDHYAAVVERAPEPSYILEYARLLESLGRTDLAADQYAVFETTQQLFAANGVEPDATATLYDADRGDAQRAMVDAEAGVTTRPFLAMQDARAWALHSAGRDAEARIASDAARSLGTRSALFSFHAGMISYALGDLQRAHDELTAALTINPYFDPLSAPIARQTLTEIGGAG